MFIGIVAVVGRIETIPPLGDNADTGVCLFIDAGGLPLVDVALGDSIAIQGVCMMVAAKADSRFEVDVPHKPLSKTTGLEGLDKVNLEEALRLVDHVEGHLVSDHADDLGTITHFVPVNESHELRVRAPTELGKYPAYKGSVVVNGVSFMTNTVRDDANGCEFSINLIPHTVAVTTPKHLKAGSQVNLETGLIACYVERMLTYAAIGLSVGTQPLAVV